MLWGKAIHHTVWLKNHTPMKVLEGDTTPFEAAYGKKPDLCRVCEWGSCCWVRNESSAKLGSWVSESIWVGLDEKLKGVWVYWPRYHIVTVECNIYFDNSAAVNHLEGEDLVIVEVLGVPPAPITLSNTANHAPTTVAPIVGPPPPPPPDDPPHHVTIMTPLSFFSHVPGNSLTLVGTLSHFPNSIYRADTRCKLPNLVLLKYT